jgi:DNA gyrase subunit B
VNNLYNKDSIQSLTPLEFTRLRPGVYVGSTEYSTQLLIEIVSNAVDEFKAGHCTEINVTISDNNVITVKDNGQGFLINSTREDGKTILEAAFSVLNTSGKYTEDGVYEGTALGLNGIGSKLVVFLSHWTKVLSYQKGNFEEVSFEEGIFKNRKTGKVKNDKESGTVVTWQASEEFFTHPEVDLKIINNLFEVLVCLCPGLTITLNEKTFFSKNGLTDLVDSTVDKNSEIIKNRLKIDFKDNKNELNLVLTYTDKYSSTIVPYVNTGLTDTGPHITQIKTILTREMNKFFRDKAWLKEKDSNLSGDDCQEGLYLVFNITAPGIAYDAQTKSRIVKIDMHPFAGIIAQELQYWFEANEKEIKKIADKAINARKAREAARKAREAVRDKGKKETGLKAKIALSNKFIDCTNKNPSQRNLLLVEGLSAGSSAVEARNPKTDCIYMLKGKTISPRKQSVEKILANQEISDIIKVIGGGFDKTFDVDKMQFDKIVITSDADSDGASIELLLTTFFFTYMRPLVEAGKLYRAVTPLYIIRQKNNEYYAYTDEELEEWKTQHQGTYELVRAKGLGELNARDLQKVCFEQERYKRITISDAEKADELLEILMGVKVEPRKQYIYENATELGFTFD